MHKLKSPVDRDYWIRSTASRTRAWPYRRHSDGSVRLEAWTVTIIKLKDIVRASESCATVPSRNSQASSSPH